MRKFPRLFGPYAHLETRRRRAFSREWSTMRNQSSAFSSPLSTPLMVRKGRGSQKEETRCITRSLIMLLPNLAERKMAWLATNIRWMKRKSKKYKAFFLMSAVKASKPLLKYFWNSRRKTITSSEVLASKP